MRYLGIDFGTKRVGIAVSDEAGSIAFPRATVPNDKQLISHLIKLIKEEKIGMPVVGDTRSHGGAENPVSAEADLFIEELKRATGKPVARAFEAWSSVEASRYAPKGREHDDAAAAAIILQRYLDMRK